MKQSNSPTFSLQLHSSFISPCRANVCGISQKLWLPDCSSLPPNDRPPRRHAAEFASLLKEAIKYRREASCRVAYGNYSDNIRVWSSSILFRKAPTDSVFWLTSEEMIKPPLSYGSRKNILIDKNELKFTVWKSAIDKNGLKFV